MVTQANYYKTVDEYGLKNLPKDMREMHELINQLTQSGSDWSVYDTDQEIRKYAKVQFDKLDELISDAKPKQEEKPVAKKTKTATKRSPAAAKKMASSKTRKPRQRKPKFAIGDKIHWGGEGAIVETIKEISHDENGYPVYSGEYNGVKVKYSEKRLIELIRDKRMAINKKPPHRKRIIPKEITYIKRYLRYNGKVVEFDDMRRFLKSLQLSITKGEIEKSSKYANLIMKIQENLVNGINTMLRVGIKEIKVEIANKKVELLAEVSKSVVVGKSTRLIKRFLTWLSKMETDKAVKLKAEIDTYVENPGIDYIDELKSIQKALSQYLNKKKISLTEMDLHGLAGIAGMEGLGFLPQMLATASGIVVGNQINQRLQKRNGEASVKPTIMSSTDISNSDFETLKFTGDWKTLIGEPSPGFSCLMFGPPKSGKSTLAIAFAKYLAQNFGKTLYVAAEEGIHATLSDKIKRLDAVHPELHFASSMPGSLSEYKFVFIDSINRSKLTHPDLIALINKNPGISFIFISQVTKDGKYRGSQEIEHDVDCIIEVDSNGIAYGKGRFAQGGEVEIGFG